MKGAMSKDQDHRRRRADRRTARGCCGPDRRRDRMIAVDGISGGAEGPFTADWTLSDLRSGICGEFHRLLPADQCLDAACAASGQHALSGLAVPGDDGTCLPEEPPDGSVVAIGWDCPHQEVRVSNQAKVGN